MQNPDRQEFTGALLSGLGSLCLYLLTLAPAVQGFDSAELTLGAYDLGFVHPPGYPLYLMLGHLFMSLPFSNPGYRLNLMSAIFASLTGVLLFKLLYRQTGSFWAALVPTALFASAPLVWSQSNRAEVYTLHLCLMTGALLAWYTAHKTHRAGGYWVCFLLLGLGAGNHTTTLLLWGPALALTIWSEPDHRKEVLLANLLAVGLAGLIYLYFPWRARSELQVDYIRNYFNLNPGTPGGLIWLASGQAFRCLLLRPENPAAFLNEAFRLVKFLWEGSLGFGLVLGVWGWLFLQKTQRNWNYLLSTYFLANLVMFLAYGAVDKEVIFLPAYIVMSLWVGSGFAGFTQWTARRWPNLREGAIQAASGLALLFVIVFGAVAAWPTLNLRNNYQVYSYAKNILDEVSPSTTIVNHWATASVFDYLRIVEGVRPDVKSFNVDFYFLGIQDGCKPISDEQLLANGWVFWLESLSRQDRLCFIEPLPDAPEGFAWRRKGSCWHLELLNP